MREPAARRLVLIVLLAAGAWLLAGARAGRTPGQPRWPADGAVYAAPGWTAGAAEVQEAWGVTHVRRTLRSAGGTEATVILSTNTTGKGVFGNADVPFLGSGYAVEPAPAGLVPPTPGRTALVAQGPETTWLLLFTYGQRGGRIGGATAGWGSVLLNAALQRPDDYYLVRVMTRLPAGTGESAVGGAARETAALAGTLFENIAAWYRA